MPGLKTQLEEPGRLVLDPAETIPLLPGLSEERAAGFDSELGCMAARWRGGKLVRLSFGHDSIADALEHIEWFDEASPRLAHAHRALVARLQAFSRGTRDDFADVPVLLHRLTEFAEGVIRHCRQIGYGQTLTYGQLASKAGSPGAARAVGNVMAMNRIPLVVPCHRVVASAGALGGFSAPQGIDMKRRLLELEGSV